jgi:hypothetical protein
MLGKGSAPGHKPGVEFIAEDDGGQMTSKKAQGAAVRDTLG